MTDTAPQALAEIAKGLTEVQRLAIRGAIFGAKSWVLTTEYEDHPDIIEDLSEDIAEPICGELTSLGQRVRSYLMSNSENAD
jgi:hypothetical protein